MGQSVRGSRGGSGSNSSTSLPEYAIIVAASVACVTVFVLFVMWYIRDFPFYKSSGTGPRRSMRVAWQDSRFRNFIRTGKYQSLSNNTEADVEKHLPTSEASKVDEHDIVEELKEKEFKESWAKRALKAPLYLAAMVFGALTGLG